HFRKCFPQRRKDAKKTSIQSVLLAPLRLCGRLLMDWRIIIEIVEISVLCGAVYGESISVHGHRRPGRDETGVDSQRRRSVDRRRFDHGARRDGKVDRCPCARRSPATDFGSRWLSLQL